MKNLIDINVSSVLGQRIREARKEAGISQEELGRRIGLGKSGISKIETGRTHISFEDASILMEAMGSRLNVVLESEEQTSKRQQAIYSFVHTCVIWFSESRQISLSEAYRHMLKAKVFHFLRDNYMYESTMPREVVIADIDRLVSNGVEVVN